MSKRILFIFIMMVMNQFSWVQAMRNGLDVNGSITKVHKLLPGEWEKPKVNKFTSDIISAFGSPCIMQKKYSINHQCAMVNILSVDKDYLDFNCLNADAQVQKETLFQAFYYFTFMDMQKVNVKFAPLQGEHPMYDAYLAFRRDEDIER